MPRMIIGRMMAVSMAAMMMVVVIVFVSRGWLSVILPIIVYYRRFVHPKATESGANPAFCSKFFAT